MSIIVLRLVLDSLIPLWNSGDASSRKTSAANIKKEVIKLGYSGIRE